MPDPWMSGGLNEMMGQLTAGTPSGQSGDYPPGFADPGGVASTGGGGGDWSWLIDLFASGQSKKDRFGNPIGPSGGLDLGRVFQASPTDLLWNKIMERMVEKGVPRLHAMQAAGQAARRAQTDANYRQQLSDWLGWNKSNPHVQNWISNGGGVPSNPTQADTPIATGGTGTGVSGTGTAPTGATDPSTARVQNPFPAQFFNNPSYNGNNYGDPKPADTYWGGWQWHQGQDYGVPEGTALSFPFAGKVTKVGYDPNGYGSYVTVTFGDQGLQMTYAHLSYVQVKEGQSINPGDQVAQSGGAGPGSGISTGAHLLVVMQDAHGNPIDPRPLLQSIYSGSTLGQLQKLGVGSTGATGATGSYVTPDGHVIWPGTPDDAYYSMVATVYEHYYGTKPPFSMVMAMRQAGIQNTDQMAAVAANWPSDIPGINFGQRENIYNTANGISIKNWGRPVPDALVKQLAGAGHTTNDDIKEWFDTHVPTDLPAAEYQQIYDATNPMFQKTYNQGPSPEYIGYLWGKNQVQPTPVGTTPATTPPVTTQTGP
jgi:murein DD-endopeptidase MepM/ murein hydrolase activator NlpD